MPHDVTLIATLAVGFVLAFVFGFAASKLRLPPLGRIPAGRRGHGSAHPRLRR